MTALDTTKVRADIDVVDTFGAAAEPGRIARVVQHADDLLTEVERLRTVVDAALLWRMAWERASFTRKREAELIAAIDEYAKRQP